MKTIEQIYNSINNDFYEKTKLEIANGSVIDNYTNSVSAGILEAYKEIENAKNPHIFTKLSGTDIDSMGTLVGCARRANEDDNTYLYRMITWNTSNQAANSTAINNALTAMTYASNVTYVPYTEGVGTATAYIIPKKLDEETIELAINETKERLSAVVSIGTYVKYTVPDIRPVRLVAYISVLRDLETIKSNIESKVEEYINNIEPGKNMYLGEINRIGVNENNVNYFSVSQLYVDNKECQDFAVLQTLQSKLLFDEIIWNVVEV